jgi:hypothetical protein
MWLSGQLHAMAYVPRGKIPRYPLNRRLGGSQYQVGFFEEEIFTQRREWNHDSSTAQPTAESLSSLSYPGVGNSVHAFFTKPYSKI